MEIIRVINSKLECMVYPVGKNMTRNKPIINELIRTFTTIEEFKDKNINLICMGSSGTIVATMFNLFLPNPSKISHIKKDEEDAHCKSIDRLNNCEWINVIVDDFVSSGNTVNSIYRKLLDRDSDVKIDCLCVSSNIGLNKLEFTPKYIIAQEIN